MVNMYRARGRGYQMATKNSGDCRYLGNQNVEKLNFLNPIYTRIWSHLTLSTPCAFHGAFVVCANARKSRNDGLSWS